MTRVNPRAARRLRESGIREDVFPAIVVIAPESAPTASSLTSRAPGDDGTHVLDRVRVVVTLDRVIVFRDSASGPEAAFSERLADYVPAEPVAGLRNRNNVPQESLLTTDSGKTLAFRRGSGCGCGSKLKTFSPTSAIAAYSSNADVYTNAHT